MDDGGEGLIIGGGLGVQRGHGRGREGVWQLNDGWGRAVGGSKSAR